jgi:hypothetical protein
MPMQAKVRLETWSQVVRKLCNPTKVHAPVTYSLGRTRHTHHLLRPWGVGVRQVTMFLSWNLGLSFSRVSHAPPTHDRRVTLHVFFNSGKDPMMLVGYIMHIFWSGPTTYQRPKCMNHDQLKLFSLSTKGNATGTRQFSPSMLVAIRRTPLYFLVKNVPSTLITGL